ncbi:hypothetical protein P9112_007482 [Eukaryota sp. TZLM1-RC]
MSLCKDDVAPYIEEFVSQNDPHKLTLKQIKQHLRSYFGDDIDQHHNLIKSVSINVCKEVLSSSTAPPPPPPSASTKKSKPQGNTKSNKRRFPGVDDRNISEKRSDYHRQVVNRTPFKQALKELKPVVLSAMSPPQYSTLSMMVSDQRRKGFFWPTNREFFEFPLTSEDLYVSDSDLGESPPPIRVSEAEITKFYLNRSRNQEKERLKDFISFKIRDKLNKRGVIAKMFSSFDKSKYQELINNYTTNFCGILADPISDFVKKLVMYSLIHFSMNPREVEADIFKNKKGRLRPPTDYSSIFNALLSLSFKQHTPCPFKSIPEVVRKCKPVEVTQEGVCISNFFQDKEGVDIWGVNMRLLYLSSMKRFFSVCDKIKDLAPYVPDVSDDYFETLNNTNDQSVSIKVAEASLMLNLPSVKRKPPEGEDVVNGDDVIDDKAIDSANQADSVEIVEENSAQVKRDDLAEANE